MKGKDQRLARAIYRRTVFKNCVMKAIYNNRGVRKDRPISEIIGQWRQKLTGCTELE